MDGIYLTDLRSGIYRHYKGKRYLVIGLARHSETRELYVVYVPLYEPPNGPVLSIRPLEMFQEVVDGVPRFKYEGPFVGE